MSSAYAHDLPVLEVGRAHVAAQNHRFAGDRP